MRFRKRRPKDQPQPVSPVEVVDLSTWNGRGDDVLTPISRPDSLGPIPHRLPVLDPDQGDLRLLVTQLIADLHARGALDAGHAAVLDHWIDCQLDGWLTVVDQQAAARRRAAEQLIAVDQGNLTREALELTHVRQQQLTLDAEYRYWRDALGGHLVAAPLATTLTDVAGAPPMPTLPDFRPATYLDNHPPNTAGIEDAGTTDHGPHPVDLTDNHANPESDTTDAA